MYANAVLLCANILTLPIILLCFAHKLTSKSLAVEVCYTKAIYKSARAGARLSSNRLILARNRLQKQTRIDAKLSSNLLALVQASLQATLFAANTIHLSCFGTTYLLILHWLLAGFYPFFCTDLLTFVLSTLT